MISCKTVKDFIVRIKCGNLFCQDLESIKIVWDLTSEWKKCWDAWKVNTFMKLKTQVMEETSTLLFKQLNKLSKQLKVEVHDSMSMC